MALNENYKYGFAWLNKMAARTKNIKKKPLKDISSAASVLISK